MLSNKVKQKVKTMNIKNNDPRHEIAMGLHHIALLIAKYEHMKREAEMFLDCGEESFSPVANKYLIELNHAKNWLMVALDKLND